MWPPVVVAAVNDVLAAGWKPEGDALITETALIAAEQEVDRLWQERSRRFAKLEQQGSHSGEDEDELGGSGIGQTS